MSRTFIFVLVSIAIVVGVVVQVLLTPHYSSAPKESEVALLNIHLETKDLRDAVVTAIKGHHSVEPASLVKKSIASKYIEDYSVLKDGTLAMKVSLPSKESKKTLEVWVWFIPVQNAQGVVDWTCVAYPKKSLTKQCD